MTAKEVAESKPAPSSFDIVIYAQVTLIEISVYTLYTKISMVTLSFLLSSLVACGRDSKVVAGG